MLTLLCQEPHGVLSLIFFARLPLSSLFLLVLPPHAPATGILEESFRNRESDYFNLSL